jgi:hypothetical protein
VIRVEGYEAAFGRFFGGTGFSWLIGEEATDVTYDWYIHQGQDESLRVRWSEDGAVVDLSAWSAAFQVRESALSTTALFTRSSAANTIALDDATNLLLTLPAATSSGWTVSALRPTKVVDGKTWTDVGVYDLELTSPEATVVRLLQGRVWASLEVTR